ncbi:MAG: hypothetical protein QOJ65_819 [Fimbriimonadaceae bacterium]|jgi:hypothetical protein|nr:hypothetical protein [Fimbriimonadaceae bacterium]
MLFTREALEQASNEVVAAYHAAQFPPDELVADLTTGIGADLLALAARGPAKGYEVDAERLEYARHNLAVYGLYPELVHRDSLAAEWHFDYAFADPSRRVAGRRTLDPGQFSPNPVELAKRMAELRLGLIKLSPLLPDTFLGSLGARLEFLSLGGECREALVGCGRQVEPGRHAVHLESDSRIPAGAALPVQDEPEAFLFEADPAAIRAHALASVPGAENMRGLGDSNGYLTANTEFRSPWYSTYRVLGRGSLDVKALRARLRELGGGTPIVKTRTKATDASQVAKALSMEGQSSAIVAVYSVGRSLRYALLERL